MKAVIYHADGPIAERYPPGTYENIFQGFRRNAAHHGVATIHLTVNGHPGWGDENYFIDADPADIVYNRELAFVNFLKQAPDDVYWFTEPDSRIHRVWPGLAKDCDVALLRRRDTVAINPSWRMATPRALPVFEAALEYFNTEFKTWHGDSYAFVRIWQEMGEPPTGAGIYQYRDVGVELRDFKQYCMPRSKWSRQSKGDNKLELVK